MRCFPAYLACLTAWLVAVVTLAWLASSPVLAAEGVTLVRDGQPLARIYVAGPLQNEKLGLRETQALTEEQRQARLNVDLRAEAVADLNHHLQQMTGSPLEVVAALDPAQVTPPAIVLGDLAVKMGATPAHRTTMSESYRLVVKDGLVLLGGESDLGARHALYTLLYKLGCDWLFPGPQGEVIPRRTALTVPFLDEAGKPDWELRAPWYSGGGQIVQPAEIEQFVQWQARQRQSPRTRGHPLALRGGHFWASLITKHRAGKLTEDPTMRALVRKPDGTLERGWAQLEATHPGVVDLTVDYIREQFKQNRWPADKTVAFSIGPNDGGGYSISPESHAASAMRHDPITGDQDQTDVLILYANRVLERLEREFPNLHLGFYIYSVHADYPARYKPHPRFVAHFADITYSRYHSILDPRSTTRAYYRNILEQWAALHREQGNPMWFYGYNWNLAENMMPYSKMKIWGEDLPYYHRMGVLGHNNEQDKAWSILGPHNYLMARLGWDMSLSWRDILREYCGKAFGKGGPAMEAYYLDLIDTQEKGGHEAGAYSAIHLIFDDAFVDRSRGRFREALAAAESDMHRRNVEYFAQPVEALALYLKYRQAVTAYDFAAGKAAFDAMVAHWDAMQARNPNLVSRYGRRYMDWLFKPFVEQGLKYSSGEYRIVYPFPDELPTHFDPYAAGAAMGMHRPELVDTHRLRTRTWGSTWDAQGLAPLREGAVWYRVGFDLDPTVAGQPVGLFIGAVEDSVQVWCNGQYVGAGRGYIRPLPFDLTEHVKPGRNLLALQVIRRGKLNEANIGGLLYPSFVFTGPRLEKKAPASEPPVRILPGGGTEPIRQ